MLAVSKDDLSLILDVFEDRLDFYSAWDEVRLGLGLGLGLGVRVRLDFYSAWHEVCGQP